MSNEKWCPTSGGWFLRHLEQQKVVPHLGGIFSKVKSLRSRAQGPNRFATGPGPHLPKKNNINKRIENNKTPRGARLRAPLGGRRRRRRLVVLNLFVDFVFLWTLGPWPWSEATYLWALGPGAKRLNFGKYAPEVGDHFLLLKVPENSAK